MTLHFGKLRNLLAICCCCCCDNAQQIAQGTLELQQLMSGHLTSDICCCFFLPDTNDNFDNNFDVN